MDDDRSKRLVWLDLETTGLDASRHAIIEIAALVTDGDLREVAVPIFRHAYPGPKDLEAMDETARAMHEASGLLGVCRVHEGRGTLRQVEDLVLLYLEKLTDPGACPLAGNSVHIDRAFLERHMARVHAHLHYRNFDASTLHEAALRWEPELAERAPRKRELHRALPDLEDSLALARYYRDAMRAGQVDRREIAIMESAWWESLL